MNSALVSKFCFFFFTAAIAAVADDDYVDYDDGDGGDGSDSDDQIEKNMQKLVLLTFSSVLCSKAWNRNDSQHSVDEWSISANGPNTKTKCLQLNVNISLEFK